MSRVTWIFLHLLHRELKHLTQMHLSPCSKRSIGDNKNSFQCSRKKTFGHLMPQDTEPPRVFFFFRNPAQFKQRKKFFPMHDSKVTEFEGTRWIPFKRAEVYIFLFCPWLCFENKSNKISRNMKNWTRVFADRYKTDEIRFQWRKVNPVEFAVDRDSMMARFAMKSFNIGDCTQGFSTGQCALLLLPSSLLSFYLPPPPPSSSCSSCSSSFSSCCGKINLSCPLQEQSGWLQKNSKRH